MLGQFLIFGGDIYAHSAVGIVAPGEAHEIAGSQNPLFCFCFPQRMDQTNHRLHGGRRLLAGDKDRHFHPCGFCLHALLQCGDGHLGGMNTSFRLISMGGTFIANETIHTAVHGFRHSGMHVQRYKDGNTRENLPQTHQQRAFRFF